MELLFILRLDYPVITYYNIRHGLLKKNNVYMLFSYISLNRERKEGKETVLKSRQHLKVWSLL